MREIMGDWGVIGLGLQGCTSWGFRQAFLVLRCALFFSLIDHGPDSMGLPRMVSVLADEQ